MLSAPIPLPAPGFLLAFASASGRAEPRPAPLNPVQAEKVARALMAEMLAQKPEQNVTNTGADDESRDAEGKEREDPGAVRGRRPPQPTGSASMKPCRRRRAWRSEADGHPLRWTSPIAMSLFALPTPAPPTPWPGSWLPDQTMIPFGGSDFWVAAQCRAESSALAASTEPGREGNAAQQVLRQVGERQPAAVFGGYARVESWIIAEKPHGIVHADAYDAHGEVLKRFDPNERSRRSRASINWRR